MQPDPAAVKKQQAQARAKKNRLQKLKVSISPTNTLFKWFQADL